MNKTVGIIAEYNPFHNGHAYQLQKAKEITKASYAAVIMSGNFVQRGAPAVFNKYERTRMALLGGADVVLELPVSYACASAEFFAKGAVGILDALNTIDFLCFGSEAGTLSPVLSCARLLVQNSPSYEEALRIFLKKGESFPSARKKALLQIMPEETESLDFLDLPNNILGVEYCKALLSLNSSVEPVTLKRKGSGYHDSDCSQSFSSASALRRLIFSENPEEQIPLLAQNMPPQIMSCTEDLLRENRFVKDDDFSLLLKYQLMQSTLSSLCEYSDLSPELARRITRRLNEFSSFSQFAMLLKTKEITYTRICRALLHVLLSIKSRECQASPSYVRILGFRKESTSLLRTMQDSSRIPVITKPSEYKRRLDCQAQKSFEADLFAADLYETVLSARSGEAFRNDLKNSPVIL